MKYTERYDMLLQEYGHHLSRHSFHAHPWRWTGKRFLGYFVGALYYGVRVALFIGYYEFFLPWRDS